MSDCIVKPKILPCRYCGSTPQILKSSGLAAHACFVLDKEIRMTIDEWNSENVRAHDRNRGNRDIQDSRKELEDDIRKWFAEDYYNDYYSEDDMVSLVLGWLDCQATITEHGIRCEQAIAAKRGGVSSKVGSKVSSKVGSKVGSKVCGGKLTAEQARRAASGHYKLRMVLDVDGFDVPQIEFDWQTIADELNAMLEKENSDNGQDVQGEGQ